ncbi:MAG: sugar phosphate isomerase/epimerase [Planctomycetes bacterium]|nr:sugar phosphate isomerase/epimerase [Planctomycetota bacterium]
MNLPATRRATRREFLRSSLAATTLAAASLALRPLAGAGEPKKPLLKKAVKFGMIGIQGSVEDKLRLIKDLGFQGVEMDSPSGIDKQEVVKARDATGIEIHGVVDSIHWSVRLSDPSPEVRARGLEGLKTALRDCKTYGGTTVLLVPGAVRDKKSESYDQVWERSTAEVRKALPLAHEVGVKIAVETVWNDFITKPEELVAYIDRFQDPLVGGYFDISNMIKYGPSPARWIRVLGHRLLKFDFKGYSHEKQWVGIGEGDEDWPEVLKALAEVGYKGYATAEVGGGGREVLKDVADRMDRVLGLAR